MAYVLKNCIKNWNRIAIGDYCNPLTHLSFKNLVENELEWHKNIELLVNHLGLGYILHGSASNPEVVVFKRIIDIFHQKAFAEISRESSKLRTYSLIKSEVKREPYLLSVRNVEDRIAMTKFRLSNHKLMIEKGRYLNLDINDRKCPFCQLIDETHFLLTCSTYAILRNDLLDKVEEILRSEPLVRTDNQLMMRYLLGNTEIAPIVAKYLNRTLKIRDFLIEYPKRLM